MDKETNKMTEQRETVVSFFDVETEVVNHIVSSEETEARGRDFINWGPRNDFPEYLRKLYKEVPTLNTAIRACVDYVAGQAINGTPLRGDGTMNRKGQTFGQVYRAADRSFWIYGGFALNVIRANDGTPVEIYPVDMRYIRSNRENTLFFYSEDWSKRWGKSKDLTYCAYDPKLNWDELDEKGRAAHASTIAYFKGEEGATYPVCVYEAAIKDCEIERMIEEFHFNDLNNSFMGSYLVNFMTTPEEDIRKEIEKKFVKKFTSPKNAGRPVFAYSPDIQHAVKLTKLEATNFEERYKTLATRARSQVYSAFRANPNLFGIATESNGFNSEEYDQTFKLFNRTMIQPVQQMLCEAFNYIYNANAKITPFSLTAPAVGGAAA